MKQIVCIDIGGTSIKGELIQGNETVRQYSTPTRASEGFQGISQALFEVIDALFLRGAAIAISSAGDIDAKTGTCIYATENLPGYSGFQIAKIVGERYKTTCRVINDGHAALLGELFYGAGKGYNSAIMLTLGTGVGGAYYKDGKMQFGKTYQDYRLGHFPLEENGRVCNCGKKGCIEQYISATSLKKLIEEHGLEMTIKELFMSQSAKANRVKCLYFDWLNLAVEMLESNLCPEVILLGGGMTGSKEVFSLWVKSPKVQIASLGNRAGILGAKYFFEHYTSFFVAKE